MEILLSRIQDSEAIIGSELKWGAVLGFLLCCSSLVKMWNSLLRFPLQEPQTSQRAFFSKDLRLIFFFCYLFINSHSLSLSLNASILCLVLGAKIASNYTGNCNTVPDHPWLQREWLSYRGANVLNRKYTQRLIPYNAHSIVPPNGVSEEACITGFSCGKNKLDFFGYFFMVSRLHQRKTFFTALHTGRNRWKLYPRPPHWFHGDQGCALGRTVPAQQSSQLPDKLNHPLLFQNICFSLCKVY